MKSEDNSDSDSDVSYDSPAELCLGCTQVAS